MAQLTVDHVTLGYEGRVIVRDLSFIVNKGDYLCIVGENGSGKTTLMRTILRLRSPMSGSIQLEEGLEQNDIGYLPQRSSIRQNFPASVSEIVLSGFLGRGGRRFFYSRNERKTAAACMDQMGITSLSGRCFTELSGGQKQKVLLARALCAAQKLLLLDEPVSGLDPEATADMYDRIRDLNRSGVTIIMISHDIQVAIQEADHILRMGETMFFGTKKQYLEQIRKEGPGV